MLLTLRLQPQLWTAVPSHLGQGLYSPVLGLGPGSLRWTGSKPPLLPFSPGTDMLQGFPDGGPPLELSELEEPERYWRLCQSCFVISQPF